MNADAVAWLHLQHGDEVPFLGISTHPDGAEVAATAEKVRLDGFPQIHDPDGRLVTRYSVISHPTLVLIDENGETELVAGAIRDPMSLLDRVSRLVT